jgi:hypothetical protein
LGYLTINQSLYFSLASLFNNSKEEEEDEWYNIPLDSDSDSNNEAPFAPPFVPLSGASSAFASRTNTPICKEYSISSRIRALIILNDKVPMARIIKVIGVRGQVE